MELWQLIARELIRATITRYAHCADRGRFADLAELFTEDGILEIEGRPPLQGRAAIVAFLGNIKTNLAAGAARPFIRHHVSSIEIAVDSPGDAAAWSYFLAVTDHGPDHWGRYRDRLTRVGDRWLFRHRLVRPDGRAPQGWSATRKESC